MTTFGLCGISPWDESKRTEGTRVLPRAATGNTCYVQLQYSNGGRRYVAVDITAQIRDKLTGGVINITLDLNEYTPPKPDTEGGFDVNVDGWDEEDHHTNV